MVVRTAPGSVIVFSHSHRMLKDRVSIHDYRKLGTLRADVAHEIPVQVVTENKCVLAKRIVVGFAVAKSSEPCRIYAMISRVSPSIEGINNPLTTSTVPASPLTTAGTVAILETAILDEIAIIPPIGIVARTDCNAVFGEGLPLGRGEE